MMQANSTDRLEKREHRLALAASTIENTKIVAAGHARKKKGHDIGSQNFVSIGPGVHTATCARCHMEVTVTASGFRGQALDRRCPPQPTP